MKAKTDKEWSNAETFKNLTDVARRIIQLDEADTHITLSIDPLCLLVFNVKRDHWTIVPMSMG